jgi:ribosomal protein S27E
MNGPPKEITSLFTGIGCFVFFSSVLLCVVAAVIIYLCLLTRPWSRSQQPPLCYPLSRSTTVFSHATTVVFCAACSTILCQPTGGMCFVNQVICKVILEVEFLAYFWPPCGPSNGGGVCQCVGMYVCKRVYVGMLT